MLNNHERSITRRVLTPLARPLAKAGIIPNRVTITGTLLSVRIAVSTLPFGYAWQGALALVLALFADSVDGTLTRITNGRTRFGAFLDSTLDRIAGGAASTSLTVWAAFSFPEGLPCTLAVGFGLAAIVGAETVPYARTCAESIGVGAKLGIAERTDRLLITILSAVFADFGWGVWWLIIGLGRVAFASLITVIQGIVFITKTVKEKTQTWRGGMTSRPGEDRWKVKDRPQTT